MVLYVLDKNLNKIAVIDSYESLLWIDRYNKPGEFELYLGADEELLTHLKIGNYLIHKNSEHTMIIESIRIETDVDEGNHYTIKGRSLEALLERRIIWKQTRFSNVLLQNAIQRIINESVIAPEISNRRISNFIFKASSDTRITSLKISAQYTGDNVLETIENICDDAKIGFKVTMNDNLQFVFELYIGEDRSYDQTENTFVVFSSNFDNIINSNYYEADAFYKNVTLVAGEGEGDERKTRTVGTISGVDRFELYTDARDIQSEEYADQLKEDTETLNSYKDKLAEDQNLLTEEQKSAQEDATEYNKVAQEHQTLISQYTARINDVFSRLVIDHTNRRGTFVASLPSEKQAIIATIDDYQANADHFQELIDESNDKIKEYDDELENSLTITYEEAVNYEGLIRYEEGVKAENEANKKYWTDLVTEAKKQLTDDENATLDDCDKMISKYTGIVENDTKKLSDERTSASEDLTEYTKKEAAHNRLINQYTSDIASDNASISTYEAIVAQDQRDLDELYDSLLEQRGKEKLADKENKKEKTFEGQVDPTLTFVYGEDFFMGDIVHVRNEYGLEGSARIVEYVMSENTANGLEYYPTFEAIQDESGG